MGTFTINSLASKRPQENEFILKSDTNGVLTKTSLGTLASDLTKHESYTISPAYVTGEISIDNYPDISMSVIRFKGSFTNAVNSPAVGSSINFGQVSGLERVNSISENTVSYLSPTQEVGLAKILVSNGNLIMTNLNGKTIPSGAWFSTTLIGRYQSQ